MIYYSNCIDVYGDTIALITEDSENISYRELSLKADDFKRHVRKRSLAFCICNDNVESITGYIGFLRGRIVPILINAGIGNELLQNLLHAYLPQYIWLPESMGEDFSDCEQIYHYRNYVLLKTSFTASYSLHDDLALLLTTSGSTGSPKLVRQSYKNIICNANSIAEYLCITPADRSITTMPMSYSYGLSIINSYLLKGASICLTNKTLMERKFWQLLNEHKITSFGGVPYIYEMLKKLRFTRMELPSLRTLTQAGGKLGAELSAEFATICRDKGIRFFVMYGQTEATARMSYLPSEYAISKAGSIGIAIPGGKFWIEDKKGNIVTQSNTAGELVYKGDNVTMGYAQDCNDLCKGDENNGMLKTGDIAKRDDDGFYYIVGRRKRFLKLFGNRVNLDEVEILLKTAGYECACAGSDDNMIIFVTSQNNHEGIKGYIMENMGISKAGFNVVHIPEIQRNDSGKVLYSALSCSGGVIV
ncbi:MAG: AMP-binding protein [Acidobacteriota bacterium]|nr:AMP-binding protein [Acidobacteriota bacterium]